MPNPTLIPRQEPTGRTTNSSNLEGVGPPLPSKLLTTYFQLSFYSYNLIFLHISLISPNLSISYSNRSGSQFSDIRGYVANPSCKSGILQYSSLVCRQPQQSVVFKIPPSLVANFFDMISGPPVLTTIWTVILTTHNPLI